MASEVEWRPQKARARSTDRDVASRGPVPSSPSLGWVRSVPGGRDGLECFGHRLAQATGQVSVRLVSVRLVSAGHRVKTRIDAKEVPRITGDHLGAVAMCGAGKGREMNHLRAHPSDAPGGSRVANARPRTTGDYLRTSAAELDSPPRAYGSPNGAAGGRTGSSAC